MFKEKFKYYKQKKPPPSFDSVIDIEKKKFQNEFKRITVNLNEPEHNSEWLIPYKEWKIFEFIKIQGNVKLDFVMKGGICPIRQTPYPILKYSLIIISNPFTSSGERYWIKRCLKDFPQKPYKLNIDAHGDLQENEIWWDKCVSNYEKNQDLIKKLRWVTLGYHHNWDTKVYDKNDYTNIPIDMNNLCTIITNILGFPLFNAEAAIINFYHEGCTLAPHTDHSETYLNAPLFSISFGKPAIFLIGGHTLEEEPSAILLKSGDVLIMSGKSRLAYHAVPRILTDLENNYKNDWHSDNSDKEWKPFANYISKSRINLNIRQVFNKS